MIRDLKRLLSDTILKPLFQCDAESREFLSSPAATKADWKVMIVLVATALALTMQEYIGRDRGAALKLFSWLGLEQLEAATLRVMEDSRQGRLFQLGVWAAGCFIFYFVVPALIVRIVFRESLGDYGVKISGFMSYWWLYLPMILFMGPVVWLVSQRASFQEAYPFYHPDPTESLWPNFWCWELMYWIQFFAIEFFFRGFMVHGLKHRYGIYSVFAMIVPYCMIHFQKPMLEAFASIVAGVVLGYLSLITRSIWLGTATHICVAISMDLTSLFRQGYFSN